MDHVSELLRPDRVEAVSFDVNGTLIHSPRLAEIYSEVLSRHGLEVGPDRLEPTIRLVWTELDCASRAGEDRFSVRPGGARAFWSRFADRVCSHLDLASPSRFAKVELFDRFSQAEAWVLFDEVRRVLKQLGGAGLRLAVVSNWDERLPKLLANLGLEAYFETIIYSSQVGVEKPYPEIFLRLLEHLDLPPQAVLHVGDRDYEDVEGALAVGMQAVRVHRQGEGAGIRNLTPLAQALTGRGSTLVG